MSKKYIIQASTFDKRGRLIASAFNDYNKSSTFMKKLALLAGEPDKIYWHAEMLALYRSLKSKREIASLVVIRYDALGRLALAKPCKVCEYALKLYKVPKVLYSTNDGMREMLF